MSTFIAGLVDMMSDTLTATPVGQHDIYGEPEDPGTSFDVPCHLRFRNRLVLNAKGQEVVSSFQATVGGVFGLSVEGFTYSIPSRFDPNMSLEPITVKKVMDENEPSHEVVIFR